MTRWKNASWLLAVGVLCLSGISAAFGEESNTVSMVVRVYPIKPKVLDYLLESNTGRTKPSDVLKQFFVDAGIPFPAGSGITNHSRLSLLIVTNTPHNLELFARVIGQLNVIPDQVTLRGCFLRMDRRDANVLFGDEATDRRMCIADDDTVHRVREWVAQDRATETCNPDIITVSGNTAQVRVVTEVIKDSGSEVRWMATAMNVTPTVEADRQTMQLTLVDDHVELASPTEPWGQDPTNPYSYPGFGIRSSRDAAKATLSNGSTLLLVVPSSKLTQESPGPDSVVLLLLTATVVRSE